MFLPLIYILILNIYLYTSPKQWTLHLSCLSDKSSISELIYSGVDTLLEILIVVMLTGLEPVWCELNHFFPEWDNPPANLGVQHQNEEDEATSLYV